ncbi:polyprenyl synthetase family protein [Allosalinactinospora lopnorensis]|uniref:polyprenyl synthetase family protein n=1 Tax=Allosalinactinospora lopnorensis TaxID=1352348 RepID=UPI0009E3ECEB|nr:polyprenyl synthetase family protein [Allosalinactinospora lopnorensis]
MSAPCPDASGGASPAPSAALAAHAQLDTRVAAGVAKCLSDYFAARRAAARGNDACFTEEIVEHLERFTLGGGKRMRPRFAWWGWRAAGGPESGKQATAALRAVSALELIQACALIQDDVMDGSTMRRGHPAMHVAFAGTHRVNGWAGDPERYGASVAVLAGDLALAWADDMLDEAVEDPGARSRVREPWRAMRTEMIAGQFLDIRAQARSDESEATALRVNRLKTAAYSVERPLHFGVALAGADGDLVRALRGYGSDVGTAFQLRDDLLDIYGDPSRTGKPVGDDLREGKRTLLLAIGLRRAREREDRGAARALRAAVGDSGLTEDDVRAIGALLDELGARAAVEERLHGLLERGLRHIAEAPIGGTARDALRALAHKATSRVH